MPPRPPPPPHGGGFARPPAPNPHGCRAGLGLRRPPAPVPWESFDASAGTVGGGAAHHPGVGMPCVAGGDPSVTPELVNQVKQLQRSSPKLRNMWKELCDSEGGGVRDPIRHTLSFLQRFVSEAAQALGEAERGGAAIPPPQQHQHPRQQQRRQPPAARPPASGDASSRMQRGIGGPAHARPPPGGRGMSAPPAGRGPPDRQQKMPPPPPPGAGGRPPPRGGEVEVFNPLPEGVNGSGAAWREVLEKTRTIKTASPEWQDFWNGVCDIHGTGNRDPKRHDVPFLEFFVHLAQQNGFNLAAAQMNRGTLKLVPKSDEARKRGPPDDGGRMTKRGRNEEPAGEEDPGEAPPSRDLLNRVREVRNRSAAWQEFWGELCDKYGGGTRDPRRHTTAFLENFLSGGNQMPTAPQQPPPQQHAHTQPGPRAPRELLSAVLAKQRSVGLRSWQQFCDDKGTTQRNPRSHTAEFLQEFLDSDPTAEGRGGREAPRAKARAEAGDASPNNAEAEGGDGAYEEDYQAEDYPPADDEGYEQEEQEEDYQDEPYQESPPPEEAYYDEQEPEQEHAGSEMDAEMEQEAEQEAEEEYEEPAEQETGYREDERAPDEGDADTSDAAVAAYEGGPMKRVPMGQRLQEGRTSDDEYGEEDMEVEPPPSPPRAKAPPIGGIFRPPPAPVAQQPPAQVLPAASGSSAPAASAALSPEAVAAAKAAAAAMASPGANKVGTLAHLRALVARVRASQLQSERHLEFWHSYCDKHGDGEYDPEAHEPDVLASYLSEAEALEGEAPAGDAAPEQPSPQKPFKTQPPPPPAPAPAAAAAPAPAVPAATVAAAVAIAARRLAGGAEPAKNPPAEARRINPPPPPRKTAEEPVLNMRPAQQTPMPPPPPAQSQGPPLVSHGERRDRLLEEARAVAKASKEWREFWVSFCDTHGAGTKDPRRHEDAFLERFVNTAEEYGFPIERHRAQAGRSIPQATDLARHVEQILANDNGQLRREWSAFVDCHGHGINSPRSHPDAFLEGFMANLQRQKASMEANGAAARSAPAGTVAPAAGSQPPPQDLLKRVMVVQRHRMPLPVAQPSRMGF